MHGIFRIVTEAEVKGVYNVLLVKEATPAVPHIEPRATMLSISGAGSE